MESQLLDCLQGQCSTDHAKLEGRIYSVTIVVHVNIIVNIFLRLPQNN